MKLTLDVAQIVLLIAFLVFTSIEIRGLKEKIVNFEEANKKLPCLQPMRKLGVYRQPPECDRCPDSHPGACQACHEEEETHIAEGTECVVVDVNGTPMKMKKWAWSPGPGRAEEP